MENITPKQQAIINAYGEYYDKVKDEMLETGFVPYRLMQHSNGITFEFKQHHIVYGNPEPYVRPSSLRGIENNNRWIRIDSEDDLPKENIDCWFILGGETYLGYYSKRKCFCHCGEDIPITDVPHYQPIKNPLPPIY